MNVEEIRKKVRSLCEDAGLQFFFAVPNASEWAVTDCEHLRKIISYHKELETLPLVTPTQKWIPITYRKPTQEEKDDYYAQRGEELCYVVENEMPLDGQEVLVSCSGIVSIDTFDEEYFDFEYMGIEDVDAWMPMPKSYKK